MTVQKYHSPDFSNMELILEKKRPKRPTLFEFIINENIIRHFAGNLYDFSDYTAYLKTRIIAYERAGYDFSVFHATQFGFTTAREQTGKTISINDGGLIHDRDSFNAYIWNEPEDYSLSPLEAAAEILPEGMKIIICCPCGVLENAIAITGYENLAIMVHEDPLLASDIFENVGERLARYYRSILDYDFVGAIMSNDDWGFNTQTMLSPDKMRKYVFPWHKRYVEDAHQKGKYAMLHSCGNYNEIINDVITDMKFDGRHSYEDNIEPVEKAYEKLKGKIAVLGGVDLNFLSTSNPEQIRERCENLIDISLKDGGYALGSGNSIPDYVSLENFLAMNETALFYTER